MKLVLCHPEVTCIQHYDIRHLYMNSVKLYINFTSVNVLWLCDV